MRFLASLKLAVATAMLLALPASAKPAAVSPTTAYTWVDSAGHAHKRWLCGSSDPWCRGRIHGVHPYQKHHSARVRARLKRQYQQRLALRQQTAPTATQVVRPQSNTPQVRVSQQEAVTRQAEEAGKRLQKLDEATSAAQSRLNALRAEVQAEQERLDSLKKEAEEAEQRRNQALREAEEAEKRLAAAQAKAAAIAAAKSGDEKAKDPDASLKQAGYILSAIVALLVLILGHALYKAAKEGHGETGAPTPQHQEAINRTKQVRQASQQSKSNGNGLTTGPKGLTSNKPGAISDQGTGYWDKAAARGSSRPPTPPSAPSVDALAPTNRDVSCAGDTAAPQGPAMSEEEVNAALRTTPLGIAAAEPETTPGPSGLDQDFWQQLGAGNGVSSPPGRRTLAEFQS